MSTVTIDLDGLAIALRAADRSHLDWLLEFYSASPSTSGAPSDARVALVFDAARLAAERVEAAQAPRAPGFTFAGRDGYIPRWTRGDETLAFDPELDVVFQRRGRSIEVVGGSLPGTARVALMRVVRELHQRRLAGRGFVLLHAAAVAWRDRVVLIAGERESGKSTLLTYLVAHGGAAFVSNDRAAVDAAGDVVGVPTIISIRSGTLERVTGLPPIPWAAGFLHRHRIAELAADAAPSVAPRRSPPSFSPAQYRAWLSAADARMGGRAIAILFPETTTATHGPVLEALAPREARARLAAARIESDPDGLFADVAMMTHADVTTIDTAAARENTAPPADAASPPLALPAYRCLLGGYPVADARALLERIATS